MNSDNGYVKSPWPTAEGLLGFSALDSVFRIVRRQRGDYAATRYSSYCEKFRKVVCATPEEAITAIIEGFIEEGGSK